MTMITPSYLGETIEYSSLHACRSTLEDPTRKQPRNTNVRRLSHPGTRLVINYYNNLWKLPLSFAKWRGLGADLLDQNWFAPNDVVNLLQLAGFEVIRSKNTILFPLKVRYLSSLLNRFLVNFPPFRWLALANFIIARPLRNRNHPGMERIANLLSRLSFPLEMNPVISKIFLNGCPMSAAKPNGYS